MSNFRLGDQAERPRHCWCWWLWRWCPNIATSISGSAANTAVPRCYWTTSTFLAAAACSTLFWQRWHTSAVCQSHIWKQKQLQMCGAHVLPHHQLPLTLVPSQPETEQTIQSDAHQLCLFDLFAPCEICRTTGKRWSRIERKSDATGTEDRVQSRKQADERRLFRPWSHQTQSYATNLNPFSAESWQIENPSWRVLVICCIQNWP